MKYISSLEYDPSAVSSYVRNVSCVLHIHRSMEIVIVTEGVLRMMIGQHSYAIGAGQAVLVESFVPHSFSNAEPHSCYILSFSPELTPAFYQWLRERRTNCCLIQLNELLYGYLCQLLPRDAHPPMLSVLPAQAILMPLCNEFAQKAGYTLGVDRLNDIYLDALEYISQHLDGDLSLAAISKHLHIRPETLCRRFAERGEMSVHEYIQYLRVNTACALLHRGQSVADAAYHVGFGSIRTFNRLFLRIIGCTPTEYIKKDTSDRRFMHLWDVSQLPFTDSSAR